MYRTNDGQVLGSINPSEVVGELRRISNTPTRSIAEFMRESADRISAKLDHQVRYHNTQVFVEDLLEIGLLIDDEKEMP